MRRFDYDEVSTMNIEYLFLFFIPVIKISLFLSFLAVFSIGNGLLRQNPRPNETNPSTASEFRRRQGNGKRIQHLHAEGL